VSAISHTRIDVDGLEVFVRESGDRSQTTLVLLSGYPSSTRAYVRFIDRLATHCHVVAIDYPGFGSSDPIARSADLRRTRGGHRRYHRRAWHAWLRQRQPKPLCCGGNTSPAFKYGKRRPISATYRRPRSAS